MENQEIVLEKPKKIKLPKTLIAVVLTAVISVLASFTLFHYIYLADGRYEKLKAMDNLVSDNFYGEIDPQKINDGIMLGYVLGLEDRYASYFSSEEAAKGNEELSGSGQGIGIIVTMHPDTENIYVSNVYNECPAAKAGILVGDQITAVDGVKVTERGYQQSVNDIIREIGDTVVLTVLRGDETLELTVEYSQFVAQTVFGQMLDSGIAYVEITSFNGGTYEQFKNTVDSLIADGAKGLIFDIRNNGGGTVDSVTKMVDYLCPEGVIMTAKYANGKTQNIANSDAEEIDLPMAVLTNGNSASASELFTASIKDFGKGVSVGEKTFGKGVMQTTYGFDDGSSVAFTVAEFLPHSGKSFNEKGIEPDIPVTLTEDEIKYTYQIFPQDDSAVAAAEEYLLGER